MVERCHAASVRGRVCRSYREPSRCRVYPQFHRRGSARRHSRVGAFRRGPGHYPPSGFGSRPAGEPRPLRCTRSKSHARYLQTVNTAVDRRTQRLQFAGWASMLAQPFLRGGDDLVQLRSGSVRADEPAFEACLRLDPEFYADEPRLQEAFEIDCCVRMGGNDVVGDSDKYLGHSVLPHPALPIRSDYTATQTTCSDP